MVWGLGGATRPATRFHRFKPAAVHRPSATVVQHGCGYHTARGETCQASVSGRSAGRQPKTPGRPCVPGAAAGFDAIPGAASPGSFASAVRDPKLLTPRVSDPDRRLDVCSGFCHWISGTNVLDNRSGDETERPFWTGLPPLRSIRWFVGWVSRFMRHCGSEDLRQFGEQEIKSFLTQLAVEGNVALNRIRLECHVQRYWRLQRGDSALTRVWSAQSLREC